MRRRGQKVADLVPEDLAIYRKKNREKMRKWREKNRKQHNANSLSSYKNKIAKMTEEERVEYWSMKWEQEKKRRENWTEEQREQYRAMWRKQNNRRGKKRNVSRHLKSVYGMKIEDYYQMVEDQNGECALCNRPLGEPSRGMSRHDIDHDHAMTGRESVRGVVHSRCNLVVGYFEMDSESFRKVEAYVASHRFKVVKKEA